MSRIHFLVLVVGLAAGAAARGDVVAASGRPPSVGVTIRELRGGEVIYGLPGGRETARGIDEIEYLQVTGWASFNLAERQYREGHPLQAAQTYQKALSELDPTPPSSNMGGSAPFSRNPEGVRARQGGDETAPAQPRLDRALLVHCRLVRLYDAEGHFDSAVDSYLAALEAGGPAWLERLRPRRLPTADSSTLPAAAAAAAVDRAVQRHGGDGIGMALASWRAGWSGSASAPAETATSRREVALGSGGGGVSEGPAALIQAGRYKAALKRIGELLPEAGLAQPELYYCRGRCLLSLAGDGSGPEAATQMRRAGVAFMRVALQFQENPRAPECLYHAARLCRRTGQPGPAAGLYRELLSRYPEARPWSQQAQRALAELTADGSSSAPGEP